MVILQVENSLIISDCRDDSDTPAREPRCIGCAASYSKPEIDFTISAKLSDLQLHGAPAERNRAIGRPLSEG